jgi:AcrR family transcriptional regulator
MTQPATSLAWIKTARPARARAGVEHLYAAGEAMLLDSSFEAASIEDITRRAGVSVPTFHAQFHDKNALLRSMHERFIAEAAATSDAVLALERWQGRSIAEVIRETVIFTVGIYRERAPLLRAFMSRVAADEDFRERSLALSLHIGELLRKLVLAHRKELLHPAPAIAAEFSTRLIHGMLQSRTLLGETGEGSNIKLTDDQITTELIHAVLAYLGVFSTEIWDS